MYTVPVKGSLLSCSILSPLLLLGRLLLSVRELLNAESASRLIVTVGGPLDVFDSVDTACLAVDRVNERVRHSLIGGAQKSVVCVCECVCVYVYVCVCVCVNVHK